MKDARELVGAMTQARVQMIAAQSIIEEAENEETDDEERDALALDAQKLKRSILVVGDVRERYARPRPMSAADSIKAVGQFMDMLETPTGLELLKRVAEVKAKADVATDQE